MWLLHRCRTLFSSEHTSRASRSASSEKCNLPKGDSTSSNLPSLTQPSKIETSFLSTWHSAQICILSAGVTRAKTGCKTNTSFWENDYRLKNIPSAACVLWPLSQNDPVPECIKTSMFTLWSKIKRVCSLTYMIVCNMWTCKTCAYTPQSSQASFLIFETKYKQRIKLKVKEKWNTESKCWPLSQEPVSVCLPSSPSKVALFFFFLHPDILLPNTNITPVQRENITNLIWGDSEERYTTESVSQVSQNRSTISVQNH